MRKLDPNILHHPAVVASSETRPTADRTMSDSASQSERTTTANRG
jgi:hypothetical protein